MLSARGHFYAIAALLIAITIFKGLLFAVLVPAWEAPDEGGYYREIVRLAETGELQSLTGHPQLYAIASYLPYRIAGESEAAKVVAIRLVSILCTSVAVLFVFLAARAIFPGNAFIQIVAPSIATFNPQFTFMGSAINSDAMVTMWAAIVVYLSIMIVKDGLGYRKGIALLLVLIAGTLTKQRMAVVYPIAIGAVAFGMLEPYKSRLAECLDETMSLRDAGYLVATLAGTVILWLLLNPAIAVLQLSGFNILRMLDVSYNFSLMQSAGPLLVRMFLHYWGYFGWLTIPLPTWMYGVYAVLATAGLAGLAVALADRVSAKLREAERSTVDSVDERKVAWQLILLASTIAVALYAVMLYNQRSAGGAQGRYLFVAIAPISILMAAGLSRLSATRFRPLLAAFAVGLLAMMNLGALFYVIHPYYA